MFRRIESRHTLLRLLAGIAFLALSLVGLFGTTVVSAHSTPASWHAVVGVSANRNEISGNTFLPHELWVNVGDTVTWTSEAGDIHTVTFLASGQSLPPFNPSDPTQALPQGGSMYDGHSYYNSGLMSDMPGVPGGSRYSLTFGVAGDFTYYCLVHGSMMQGVVHVNAAGTPYPYSQRDYNRQIEQGKKQIFNAGYKLIDIARDESNNHHVTLGIGNGLVSIMRFYPQNIVVHVGDSVTFTDRDTLTPHTVTYGPPPSNDFAPYGNPHAFDGSAPLNSGFLGVSPQWFGTSYTITFVKAGTYAFRCDLHEMLGMVAKITVVA